MTSFDGEPWTIDSGERAENHFCGCHGCAGVPGRGETGGRTVAHQAKSNMDRRLLLGSNGLRGLLVHANMLAGMHDLDGQPFPIQKGMQAAPQRILWTY